MSKPIQPVALTEKFALIPDAWHPRIVGELGEMHVKLAKFRGQFQWHHHEHEDELFLVVRGQMRMGLREGGVEREVLVGEGEFLIVPRGVEHLPGAVGDEAWVLLLEPKTTLNTGTERGELTREHLEWL